MAIQITPSRPFVITPSDPPVTIRPVTVTYIRPVETIRIEPRPITAVPITPQETETVRPPDRVVWDERGWSRRFRNGTETYEGFYQVGPRRFAGRLEAERRGRQITAFIHDPPPEIRRHRHGPCFQQVGVGTGWFHLHWRRSPRTVDQTILYVEQILDEALNR